MHSIGRPRPAGQSWSNNLAFCPLLGEGAQKIVPFARGASRTRFSSPEKSFVSLMSKNCTLAAENECRNARCSASRHSTSTCKRGEGLAPSKKIKGYCSPVRSPNISCHLYHDTRVVGILIERLKQRCISIKSTPTSLRRGVLKISSAKVPSAVLLRRRRRRRRQ